MEGRAPWITEADMEDARRRDPGGKEFARLWQGLWVSQRGDAISEADINAMFELEGPMADLESILRSRLREPDNDTAPAPDEVVQIRALLTQAAEAVDDAERRLVEVSPIGEAVLEQVTVSRSDLDRLTSCVEKLVDAEEASEEEADLRGVAQRLCARPLGELAAPFIDTVPRWAEERKKKVLFEVEGKRCMVPPELAAVLPRALTHLLRNAVAHGIELPQVREDEGKPGHGSVTLTGREDAHGRAVITVRDDGAGLDVHALEQRAAGLGITDAEPGELIFENGLSTSASVDSLSGQGVGMGAARQTLQAVGYTIDVSTETGRGACFEIRPQAGEGDLRRAG